MAVCRSGGCGVDELALENASIGISSFWSSISTFGTVRISAGERPIARSEERRSNTGDNVCLQGMIWTAFRS